MKTVVLLARLILGAIFVIFSLNYVLNFIQLPELPKAAGAFMMALGSSGYIFPVATTVELVSGLLLLTGVAVPLALTLLAPIILNIFLFHLRLAPEGLPLGSLVLILNLFLAWAYRGAFRGVLSFRAKPTS